jgi:hypothetical protein
VLLPLEAMSASQIRRELEKRHLPTTGLGLELIKRLKAAIAREKRADQRMNSSLAAKEVAQAASTTSDRGAATGSRGMLQHKASMRRYHRVTDNILVVLARKYPQLRALTLQHAVGVTFPDNAQSALQKRRKGMLVRQQHGSGSSGGNVKPDTEERGQTPEPVDAGGVTAIETALVAWGPTLRLLDLSGSFKVVDATVKVIVRLVPTLEDLNLSGCGQLTDLALKHIAHGLVQLKRLRIACTVRVAANIH